MTGASGEMKMKMRKTFESMTLTAKNKSDGLTVYKGGASPAVRRDD